MNFRSPRSARRTITIELTSMIDVVFLLLIFFLITTTFVRPENKAISVDLPKGVSGASQNDNDRLVVLISDEGEVFLEGDEPLTDGSFLQEMRRAFEANPDQKVLVLSLIHI